MLTHATATPQSTCHDTGKRPVSHNNANVQPNTLTRGKHLTRV